MKTFAGICFFFISSSLFAQSADTLYNEGSVSIRSNIIVTFDSAAWTNRQMEVRTDTISEKRPLRSVHRQSNSCGVISSFTPAGDTTFATPFLVIFTSSSVNAISQQWIINGIIAGTQLTLPFSFSQVGLYEIKLVAKNGSCSDTSTAYYLYTGTSPSTPRKTLVNNYGLPDTEEFATAIEHLPGGDFLLGGYSNAWPDQLGERGLVIKLKESGCVQWTKLFQGEYAGRIGAIKALRDSGFIVSVLGYLKSALLRFDKTGQLIWKHNYVYGSGKIAFNKIYEAADGSLFTAAQEGGFNGFYIARLTASGTSVWCKYYLKAAFDMIGPLGITEVGSRIFISGYLSNPNQEVPYNSEYNKDGFIVSINSADGKTVWSKTFGAVGVSDFFQEIHAYGPNLLVNDIRTNYLGGSVARQAFHFIDTSGQVLKSRIVQAAEPIQFPFTCNIVPLSNNRLYLTQGGYQPLSLQPGYVYKSYWQKIDTSDTIHWQSVTGSISRHKFWYSTGGNNETLASLGEQPNSLTKAYWQTSNFLFAKIDSSGPETNNCIFGSCANMIVPDQILSFPLVWIKDTSISLQVTDPATLPGVVYTQMRYQCPDFIDSCSYVKINGMRRLCNLNQTYTYHASKTKGCSLPVEWKFSTGVQLVSQTPTDVTVRFSSFGQYTIYALLNYSCNPIIDSITVVAASGTVGLNLGADTSLCAGGSITLHAGAGFQNYRWQDNSTDSIFTVASPGNYWVTVIDSCGNVLADTITILAASTVPISIGPDRSKCNSDTLHLSAPSGFINYTWGSNYNISSTTAQNVTVNPAVDTAYYIRAEKTPGCFAFDTVRVTVYHSPAINLGADTSFCFGDSARLDAGPGFQTYVWSSGQTGRLIAVKTAADYSVVGTTAQGCKSYDTVKVLRVYPLPVVSLDRGSAICTGTVKTLNAGNFVSYVWNTGATAQTVTVSTIGRYAVTVTDANGCKGSDTTAITTIYPLPSGFLPPDTAVCSYGTVELKALNPFSRYLWNTGAIGTAITVSRPGLYWLDATDNNSCRGRDSVTVNPKDCLKGFYMPTAFTPNGDGKNDVLRPLLFGKLTTYRFSIYNRWGGLLFGTGDVQKGWDGKLSGMPLPTGAFVWMCTYGFEGEPLRTEKGTVTLVR